MVFSLLILFNLMWKAICSSETPVITRATRRHIPEDGILQKVRAFRMFHDKYSICIGFGKCQSFSKISGPGREILSLAWNGLMVSTF
jgi:hypothetical protein